MDTAAPDQESEQRNILLETIREERLKCKTLKMERRELEFSMLHSTDLKMRKLDEFLCLNVRDPMSYLNEEYEPEIDKEQQQQLMNSSFDILNIRVGSISVAELEDELQEYTVNCSLHGKVCKLSLKFSCKSLDSPYVELLDVKLHDPKQADDAQQLVEVCLKKNSIPLLLQGLLEYCNKVCQRAEFLQELDSQFSDSINIKESDDDGTLTIVAKDHVKDKSKLELQWGILYDADLISFSFAFGIKCQSNLRKQHPDVIKGVVESKSMTRQLRKNFKKLMSLVSDYNS